MSLPKAVKAWAWYDFANSGYILVFSSFLLPAYFASVLLHYGYPLTTWGLANGLSTALGIILSIIGGKFADSRGKLNVLRATIFLTFIGMAALSFATSMAPTAVFTLFIVTQAFFIFTLSLSDSVLPHLSRTTQAFRYSGFAWGVGYIGGIVSLLIVMVIQGVTSEFSLLAFLGASVFYLLFSLVALNGLRTGIDLPPTDESMPPTISRQQKIRFLLGFWVISEVITVFILFFSLYCSKELGLTSTQIGYFLLLIQLVALPATIIGGKLAVDQTKTFLIFKLSIACFIVSFLLLLLPASLLTLVLVAILGGLAVGNSQSILRAQYARVVDPKKSGAEFGVYSFVSQAAVVIGPILYGWSSDALQSQRLPLIALTVAMCVGFLIIAPVMKKRA